MIYGLINNKLNIIFNKWSWHTLIYYPGIFPEGLKKTTVNLGQDNLQIDI